jgi:type VI secretion system protein ImpB
MSSDIFDIKERVRKPAVHIKYKVQRGDAIELKELPFVVGVMADLSGQPKEPLEKVKDRTFVAVDRDNFDQVLAGMRPRLAFRVQDTEDETKTIPAELNFRKMEDFSPENVAKQVAPTAKLLELLSQLKDLQSRLDNDRLEEQLQAILDDPALQQAIKSLSDTQASGGEAKREGN